MLAAIPKTTYHNSSLHHHLHHLRSRTQQRLHHHCHGHNSYQRHIGLVTWLKQNTFGLVYSVLQGFIPQRKRPTRASRRNIVTAVTKDGVAFFFMLVFLMPPCADARTFNKSNGLRLGARLPRRTLETDSPFLNNRKSTSSHSTNSIASTKSSAFSTPSFSNKEVIPEVPQPSHLYSEHKWNDDSDNVSRQTTRSQLISLLISTLEKLHILNSTDVSCFRLDKIIHTINDCTPSQPSSTSKPPSEIQASFAVHLYFQESHHRSPPSGTVANVTSTSQRANTSNSNSVTLLPFSCVSDPVIEVHMPNVSHLKQEDKRMTYSEAHRSKETSAATTDVQETLHPGRLSRTQIVVISTCSAIIGMFFLIAGFLRIRNYIKRSRLEQELARRPKFRSCSVVLRGATQSMEQLRRDSLTSRASHQNSLTTHGSNGSNMNGSHRENPTNSPHHHHPLMAPLLLNSKALQQIELSAPTESHIVLRHIDKEVLSQKKKSPRSIWTKNDNLSSAGKFKQEYPAEISIEGVTSTATEVNTLPSSTGILLASQQDCQAIQGQMDGSMNPSFSSGSISCQLPWSQGDPGVGQHITMSCIMNSCNTLPGSDEDMPGFVNEDGNLVSMKSRSRSDEIPQISDDNDDLLSMSCPHGVQSEILFGSVAVLRQDNMNKDLSFLDSYQADEKKTLQFPDRELANNSFIPEDNIANKSPRQGICEDDVNTVHTRQDLDDSSFTLPQSDVQLLTSPNYSKNYVDGIEPHHRDDDPKLSETFNGGTIIDSFQPESGSVNFNAGSECNNLFLNSENAVTGPFLQPCLPSDVCNSYLDIPEDITTSKVNMCNSLPSINSSEGSLESEVQSDDDKNEQSLFECQNVSSNILVEHPCTQDTLKYEHSKERNDYDDQNTS